MTSRRRKPQNSAASISLVIDDPRWRDDPATVALIRKAVRRALKPAPDAGDALPPGMPSAVTVLLTGDLRLRELNANFRGKDKATNVLSFSPVGAGAGYLGDIALAFGVVSKEARAQRKTVPEHAAHLAMHGVLHLLGYDHEKANDAKRMEALEIALLEHLGIANPYVLRPYTTRRKKA
jgi:probable rRNA maturation factor